MPVIFCNANIFTPEGYLYGGFEVINGRFAEILPGLRDGGETDLHGRKVIPGLIDIHIHGCAGRDFSDGEEEGVRFMAKYLARRGITGFAPTSMTLPHEALKKAFESAARVHECPDEGAARIAGIHMEGPFLSGSRKGAQNGEYLRNPDIEEFRELQDACGGLIRIVDLAPELEGARDFTLAASRNAVVSAAHTDADYEQASALYEAGASHLTHLYNAMPFIRHRSPGVIGAASERQHVTAELICDGIHVHPSAVRMAFRLFPERICLISDALRCCGMPDGSYELGGQNVYLEGGAAHLEDGTIAGSAADLHTCLQNAVRFQIPEEEAIRAATLNPAKVMGIDREAGSIAPGKRADFLICDRELNIRTVYIEGKAL